MTIFSKRDSRFLYNTRTTFDNINKNPVITAELEKVSYNVDRILAGKAIHTEAEGKFRELLDSRKVRKSLTRKMGKHFKAVSGEYTGHAQRMRKELVDFPEILDELGLTGPMKTDISGFIDQASHFYGKALGNPQIAAAILPFGFTPELLTESQTRFLEYQTARSNYEKSGGELQRLVEEKDKAIKKLRKWMAALTAAARVAFAGNLQALEEIGLFMRNKAKPKDKTPGDTDPPVVEPPEPTEPAEPAEPAIAA